MFQKILAIVACTILTVTTALCQNFQGGYGPTYPILQGYPWPAFLPPPPSFPVLGVLPYSSVPLINPQQTQVTCWAASMSNLFRFYGYDIPEVDIVAAMSPRGPQLASPAMLAGGMNRVWSDRSGKRFRVSSKISSLFQGSLPAFGCDNQCVFSELSQGHPVLMGTQSHAMVIYAAMPNQFGSAFLLWANDPAPTPTPFSPNPMAPRPPRYLGSQESQAFFLAAAKVDSCAATGPC